jgi:hypothetical protein
MTSPTLPTSSFVRKTVGKDEMIYDPDRDAVHILNPTAQLVAALRAQGLGAEAIARELLARYPGAGAAQVLADVQACLDTMDAQHLLPPGP